jgi:phosphoribosylaminoimidazolecarboxamide formyltransferase/IMP cyclohydrolase
MTQAPPIRRALISVSDKSDLVPFARALQARGVEIISTGGTAAALADAGVEVTPIDRITGFPEIMDGRVKTLHPSVHGALLALRDNEAHQKAMADHDITPIDLVCVNLYPFERTISKPGVEQSEAIEQIDIGGPSMLRSAAKNFMWVTVVTSPRRYDRVIADMDANAGATSLNLRSELAAEAFARTSEYDAAIAAFLGRRTPGLPEVLQLGYLAVDSLRYGENPHQDAVLYRDPASTGPTIVNAEQLHGKLLSYNNIVDASCALETAKALRKLDETRVGACVVKHTNPCGAALAPTAREAIDLGVAGNPRAAYGGILAVNRQIDAPAAESACAAERFFEVIVAPSYSAEALSMLRARWAGVRLLAVGDKAGSSARKLEFRSIPGGMLVQDRDTRSASPEQWKHAAGPAPSAEDLACAAFLETASKYVASNAIVVGGPDGAGVRLFGVGAGQMDRVTSCRLAVEQAGDRARGALAVGDAFFPFSDGPEVLIEAGVKMIVHPGGSKRDDETLALCDKRGVTCMTTGVRHFRH